MLLDHSPHNSHSWFQFSCAVSADRKLQPVATWHLHSSLHLHSLNSPNTALVLSRLMWGCEEPVSADWSSPSLLGVTSGSVGGVKIPADFSQASGCSLCFSVSWGGVKVCICRAVRQRWGQISTSTGLISPVLFSRTHSSLSLHGSTHCRSLSTGSIVWTKKEQPSVKVSDKPAYVFCLPRLRWCIMLESDSAQVLSSRERNLAAFNVQHIYNMLIVHSKKHLLQSA